MHNEPSPQRPNLIRLIDDEPGRLVVAPAELVPEDPYAFEPFDLPKLPLSLHCWLAGLGAEFYRRHDRCIAALLVLDCRDRRWLRPVIPAQACGQDGACWTLDLGDAGPLPPHRRVGGSYQVRLTHGVMDSASTVPPFDGLHLVQGARPPHAASYCFARAGGQTSVIPPDDILEDDWDRALHEAADRISFE